MLARCDKFVQFIERDKELDFFLILDRARQVFQALDQVILFVFFSDIIELSHFLAIFLIIFKATNMAVP